MYASAVLDLRFEKSWEPRQLTAEAFRWPVSLPQIAIAELALLLAPRTIADAGSPVIIPANIDVATGSVRRRSRNYQGPVFQVGSDLRLGDVLVPRLGAGPALLVSEQLRGALISSRFSALRPTDGELSLWIWAVLSSESGRQLRTQLAQGAAIPIVEPQKLSEAVIPVPPRNHLASMARRIEAIATTTHAPEDEAIETWWHTIDLRTTEWRIALATPDPSRLTIGAPLGDFCDEIVRGRNTRPGSIDTDAPGYLPVADVSVLGGKQPRRWLPAETRNLIIAHPGDLLVAGLGNLAHATIAERMVAVDKNVYALRLRDPSLGRPIANYLNSQDGYGARQMLATGSTIPSIRASDIARIPLPAAALEISEQVIVTSPLPLSQRLEQVLWKS